MDQRRTGGVSVTRRTYLVRGGATLVGTFALAGCTDDVGEELPTNEHWPSAEIVPDLPVRERTDVMEAGIEEFADSAMAGVGDFEAELRTRDVEFESVEEVVELLYLEYVETDIERRGSLQVTALLAGAYASLVAGGFGGRGLELVFFAPDGMTIGLLEIATEWAVEFNRGALSAGEYGELVVTTIESKRTPPAHDVAPDE